MAAASQSQTNPFQLMADMPEMPVAQSLAQKKEELLSKNRSNKISLLSGNTVDDTGKTPTDLYNELYGESSGAPQPDYLDQLKAGAYRLGRDTAQLGTDIAGWGAEQLGYNEEAEQLRNIKYRDNNEINAEVGFDDRYHNQKLANVSSSYDALSKAQGFGETLSAGMDFAGDALSATPGLIADSAAMMGSMMIPGLGGAGVLAKFGIAAAKTGSKTVPAMLEVLDKAIKINPATVTIGTGMANQQIREYEATTGETATWQRIVGSNVANVSLMGIDLNILKGLVKAIPADFAKAMTIDMAKALAKNGAKDIGRAVMASTGKIASAFGQEAAQEYAQTWTQILTEQGGTLESKLQNPKNIKEANISGSLGGFTAGSIRAAPMAVSGTINTSLRGVGKAIEYGVDKAKKKGVELSYKVLDQDQRDKIKADYVASDKATKETVAANEASIETLSKATNIDELRKNKDPMVEATVKSILDKDGKNDAIAAKIAEAKDIQDLKDISIKAQGAIKQAIAANPNKDVPLTLIELKKIVTKSETGNYNRQDLTKNFESIKSQAIAQYSKTNLGLKTAQEATRAKDFVYQASKSLYQGGKDLADKLVPKEIREAIVTNAKKGIDLAKSGADILAEEIKDLDKSAIRGMFDDIAKGKTHEALYAFSESQLADMKEGYKDNNKARRAIDKIIQAKKKIKQGVFKEYIDTKKGKGFLAGVVSGAKVITKDLNTRIAGLTEITKEAMLDSDNLSAAKTLVDDLRASIAKDSENATPEAKSRLREALRDASALVKAGEQGFINTTAKSLSKAYRDYDVNDKIVYGAKYSKVMAKKAISDAAKKVHKSKTVAEAKKYVEELDAKLASMGAKKSGIVTPDMKTESVTETEVTNESKPSLETFTSGSKKELRSFAKSMDISAMANILSSEDLDAIYSNPMNDSFSGVKNSVIDTDAIRYEQAKNKGTDLDNAVSTEPSSKATEEEVNTLKEDRIIGNTLDTIQDILCGKGK